MKFVSITGFVFIAQLWFFAVAQADQTLYKTVDRDGHVTFSDAPVEGSHAEAVILPSETINVLPSDSTQALIEEQKRADVELKAKSQAAQRNWSDRYRQAQRDVEQAEIELERAKVIQEGDMVGNALGGARPNAAWVERLEKAEANLQERRDALARLQR